MESFKKSQFSILYTQDTNIIIISCAKGIFCSFCITSADISCSIYDRRFEIVINRAFNKTRTNG